MGIEKEMELKVENCQNWLKTQKHLPEKFDKTLIIRYIHACRGDLDKAKALIDLSYTMRNKNPNIFLKRDPTDAETQNVFRVTDMLPLPNTTKENYKILLYRLADTDIDKYDFTACVKVFFMVGDIRLITPDDNEGGITDGEIPIFDMDGFSLRHLTKVVLSTLRCYMKYTQEAHPVRLKHVHVINCSSFLDRIMTVVKPFIKSEVFKLIHFHLPNSDTLEQFVPKELLPNEYGGKAGNIKDIKSYWIKLVEQNRDYLMDANSWKIDESKRGYSSTEESFKTLTID